MEFSRLPRYVDKNTLIAPKINPKSATSAIGTNDGLLYKSSVRSATQRKPLNQCNKPLPAHAVKAALTDLCKKTLKRPAPLPAPADQKKVRRSLPKQQTKAKPAPYDYKARFTLLKEKHDALKSLYDKLKEDHGVTIDENEDLTTKNRGLNEKNKILTEKNEEISLQNNEFKEAATVTNAQLKQLKQEHTILKKDLENCRDLLGTTQLRLEQVTADNQTLEQQLENTSQELNSARNTIEQKTNCIDSLTTQIQKFDTERRYLHNQIQELKGNIRVFCRVRPQLLSEKHKLLTEINFKDEKTVEINKTRESIDPGRPRGQKLEFSFDRVFEARSTQQDVFVELAQLVQSALDGYNVCVFAYGQTGSGKTYTMEGIDAESTQGMIPRAVDLIFSSIASLSMIGWTYEISASFLEIYNETIVDLLNPKKNQHEIRMTDATKSDVFVTNLTVKDISCSDELKKYLKLAQRNRAVAATENNDRSSRSHSVAKISLKGSNKIRCERCSGSLNLVDLAGSERINISDHMRAGETKNINRSLANLSKVILCLTQKQEHVPYRDSKLTHLLMPCLGGNSKTLMLVNISPNEDCVTESVNSLRFAAAVNRCTTGNVKRNRVLDDSKNFN